MITEHFISGTSNYTLCIGTNKTENWQLLDNSNETNIWFHVFNSSSGYVILHTEEAINKIPKNVIRRCAHLCKIRSTSRNMKKCPVMYSQVRNVSKGKHVGEATVTSWKTVSV
jgi:predicted ribosome quality control (RQC) complex YloA/Tae2 family protein